MVNEQKAAAVAEYKAARRALNDVNDRMIAAGTHTETDEWVAADKRLADAEQNVSGFRRWLGGP